MSKIEGIPEGWELVRVGVAVSGDTVLMHDGMPTTLKDNPSGAVKNWPIIRRIPPPLSIPPKVFADGWIAGQCTGPVLWFSEKPEYILTDAEGWRINGGLFLPVGRMPCLLFDSSLPESQRICRVTWEHGSECDQC